jgi:YhcH/YjgK/YiaL family protein
LVAETGHDGARLEVHRRYIDIQCTLSGHEEIGWRPLARCTEWSEAFDAERDIGFFAERPETWLVVPAEHFAMFFPDDAHAPLAGFGLVKKAIVKIAV